MSRKHPYLRPLLVMSFAAMIVTSISAAWATPDRQAAIVQTPQRTAIAGATISPTQAQGATAISTETATLTPTLALTPTLTLTTGTATLTSGTATAGPTASATLVSTARTATLPTVWPTVTSTARATITASATSTASATPTATATPTSTLVPTLTSTPTSTPKPAPPQVVVVIPGTTGSIVHQPSDGEKLWFRLKPSVLQKLSLETNKTVNVPDLIRKLDIGIDEAKLPKGLAKELEIYEPLINALKAHFPEYDAVGDDKYAANGQRKRRTSADCDKTQTKARLFIFPYDWRKSNAESAVQLKDYIDCIRAIYPDARVDIVAHSMGGLIARRMILDTNTQDAGKPHPYVNRLITAGTPWWGAPRANYVLETGDITGHPSIHVVFEHNALFDTVKAIAKTFPGAHELLPTKLLFQNAPAGNKPFGEEPKGGKVGGVVFDAWDIDASGAQEHNYDYDRFKKLINEKRFADVKPLPMTANEAFHDNANAKGNKQDDWAKDSTGVTYYHIIGKGVKTPDKVQARAFIGAPKIKIDNWRIYIEKDKYFTFSEGEGDGTVPLLSAARTDATNAPGATRQVFKGLSHLEIVSKKEALDCILKFLGVGDTCQKSEGLTLGPLPASRRVTLVNVQDVEALDSFGDHIDDDGVVLPYYGDRVAELSMPPDQPVTITFSTLPVPETAVLVRIMTTNDAEQAVRKTLYLDSQTRQQLPPEPTALLRGQLTIDAQGNTTLQYDWDRNGIIDQQDAAVFPTVDSVNPTLVQDEVGPDASIVSVRQDPDGTRWVTLTATDPSGILPDSSQGTPSFLVSLENDRQVIDHAQKYIPGTEVEVLSDKRELTACVVDGAGNRACQIFSIP